MREKQERYWEDVQEGDELPSLQFPLSVYRLVMAASANQDFNSIHHNSEYAKKTGAPDMYANNIFLQGMWERTVREYIGNAGVIKSLRISDAFVQYRWHDHHKRSEAEMDRGWEAFHRN